jgi:hypothetical protein
MMKIVKHHNDIGIFFTQGIGACENCNGIR